MYFSPEHVNAMFLGGAAPSIPVPPPPMVHNARAVRNDVNLKKDTLKFVRDPTAPGKHYLEFGFDAGKACAVSVFFCATESVNHGNITTGLAPKRGTPTRVVYPKGLSQHHSQQERKEDFFEVSRYTAPDLSHRPEAPHKYPVVVLLEAVEDTELGSVGPARTTFPGSASVQSQATYASITRHGDGTLSIKVLKQKIQVLGQAFEMQAIYGVDRTEGDAGSDCVVCMSEPRTTTVLPCRHMCLCDECAQQLRLQTNKCPICRAAVESLLQIDLSKHGKGAAASADDEGAGAGAGPAGAAAI